MFPDNTEMGLIRSCNQKSYKNMFKLFRWSTLIFILVSFSPPSITLPRTGIGNKSDKIVKAFESDKLLLQSH